MHQGDYAAPDQDKRTEVPDQDEERSVSAANTPSGEALMTRTAVSVRIIAGAPVALVDHARAERPGLDQV
jgi:hypothetical protein